MERNNISSSNYSSHLYRYIPNALSLMRGILVFPFIYGIYRINKLEHGSNSTLIILFSVIIITDILDGFLARKFDSVSALGAKLDILSDALYTLFSLFILTIINITPSWFIYVMAIKLLEFLITSKIVIQKQEEKNVVFFDKIGKLSVSMVMLLPGIFVFRCIIQNYIIVMNNIIYIVTIMFMTSFVYRIIKTVKVLNDNKK